MQFKSIVCIILLIGCLSACIDEKNKTAPPPPPKVSVIEISAQDIPLYQEFVGQTSGLKDIAIRARLEGFLEGVHFEEGSEVSKGTLLYSLESQPFEEKVAARMSGVAEVETMLAKAKGDLDRIRPLAEINAVSKSDLDAAVAAYEATGSSLDAANAALRSAKIELGYTKIYSPIDGIIGRTKAKVGDFVGRDPNPVILNTVSQVDPILVTFFITESQYLELAPHLAAFVAKRKDGETAGFEMILVDGSLYEYKGKPDFVDREVDPTTGSILVQASFPNPKKVLRPGQFVKVKVRGREHKDAILVPQRCVMEMQGLYNVFVVDANNTVQTREIEVGPKIGSMWLITEGLKAGEQVVYEGLQNVKDGVTAQPTVVAIVSSEQSEK